MQIPDKILEEIKTKPFSVSNKHGVVGLDGFVDKIVAPVKKRHGLGDQFDAVSTIAEMGTKISAAAGKSANIELYPRFEKLGGNGPIMANAMLSLGMKVRYIGALGQPNIHPVFEEFYAKTAAISLCEPGITTALEFKDGKLMLGNTLSLEEIDYARIIEAAGEGEFIDLLSKADIVSIVNWTMIPTLSDVWESLLEELCPVLTGPRRKIFFDLADPAKRTRDDIRRAAALISRFNAWFEVILGLNEREAFALAEALDLPARPRTPEGITALALDLQHHLGIDTLAVHPTLYAVAASHGRAALVEGPRLRSIVLTTGAGDHFNSGFCLGKLLGFDNDLALLTAVATSGFYVSTGRSPGVSELAIMLENWPV